MPPSPALRCSPGRELRRDSHKRGRSLEGGILFREKKDDLALFNEMKTRERDDFLLQSNDDFEDIFATKLKYFSENKIGISIPARGESSELLHADGEKKSDYDWLVTPPDTPLFPSLDDEEPPVTLAPRGRPRSQPISISRSSTMERSHRSSRGSASPNRLSPSPRSASSTLQTKGSTSSAPHSSPNPGLHHATPSQRLSPQPSKPSTPVRRSPTPTLRKTRTGPSGSVSSSRLRGTSPVNASRGNSASPKIQAWQANIPGFSLDAPPNLRTSLADRPMSHVRGSSPASRTGRDSSSRHGRDSVSPTASRSVSSSHSHDRVRFSSHGKGSIASSGDDDRDSLQSIPISNSDPAASRIVGAFPSTKAPLFTKKPTQPRLSSSAPKRYFDSALRQMDLQKGSQNMFRPLLSSVPTSTFYVGKASAARHALISRNSSLTTSSNASSDLGTSGVHDTEWSDHNQDDMAGEFGKAANPDFQDDIFAFEKADDVNNDISPAVQDGFPYVQHGDFSGDAGVGHPFGCSEVLEGKGNSPEAEVPDNIAFCCKCGHSYHVELTDTGLKLCPDCEKSSEPLMAIATDNSASLSMKISDDNMSSNTTTPPMAIESLGDNSPCLSVKISEDNMSFNAVTHPIGIHKSSGLANITKAKPVEYEDNIQEGQTSCAEKCVNQWSECSLPKEQAYEDLQRLANLEVIDQPTAGCPDGDTGPQQVQHLNDSENLKLDVSEGAGISVLLKRSSSSKGPVVQSRTFTASGIAYDHPSYARVGASSSRSSTGQGCASASSSVDLGSDMQLEARIQRQLSSRKSNIETYRYDTNAKHQRSWSSSSVTSSQSNQGMVLVTNIQEENSEVAVAYGGNAVADLTNTAPEEQSLASEMEGLHYRCMEVDCNNHFRIITTTSSELSPNAVNICLGESVFASVSNDEDSASHVNCEDFQNDAKSVSVRETADLSLEPSTGEEKNSMQNFTAGRVDLAGVPTESSLDTITNIENGYVGSPSSHYGVGSPDSRGTLDEVLENSVDVTPDKAITTSVAEPDNSDHAHSILEEPTIMVEGHDGTKARSLTLEEAADTILFCSSIIHNLSYEAATIAIEKENLIHLEGLGPMVTTLGNSGFDRKNPHDRTAIKPSPKLKKLRKRQVETETKLPSGNTDSNEKVDEVSTTRIVGVPNKCDSLKPPKPESKCNCTIM
ncbi:hypothetical protein NMG60_11024767 [Bertholletia excelsa]